MKEGGFLRELRARARGLPQFCLAGAIALSMNSCTAFDRLKHGSQPQTQTAAEQPPVTITPPVTQPPPAKPRRTVHEAPPRETPREPERVASIDPNSLIGLAPAAVERLLGSPSAVSKGEPSLVWTYTGQGCSFQIFFYPDLKTASFHALKYGSTGGANEPSDACVRNILTVKANGPG